MRLSDAGYSTILGLTGAGDEWVQRELLSIIGRRPDGIILTGALLDNKARRKQLKATGITIIETWDLPAIRSIWWWVSRTMRSERPWRGTPWHKTAAKPLLFRPTGVRALAQAPQLRANNARERRTRTRCRQLYRHHDLWTGPARDSCASGQRKVLRCGRCAPPIGALMGHWMSFATAGSECRKTSPSSALATWTLRRSSVLH